MKTTWQGYLWLHDQRLNRRVRQGNENYRHAPRWFWDKLLKLYPGDIDFKDSMLR